MTAQFATSKICRAFALCITACLMICGTSTAQDNGGGGGFDDGAGTQLRFRTVVGGIEINADGVLDGKTKQLEPNLREDLLKGLNATDKDIHKKTKMRTISLKGLEASINEAIASGKQLPADVQFMAGLQRIEYIILSPETNDVLISGPAEGWTVNKDGQVVGKDSGTPVIQLEDFLVAMRYVEDARQGQGVSVSIDPTAEGIQRLHRFYDSINQFRPNLKTKVEELVGQQQITLTGVPKDSRFSQVLVAADYKMKRYSMGLDKAPIADMPSVLELAQRKDAGFRKMAPRFWMECNYQPIAKSADNKVWQLRGQGVKALTEDSFFNEKGKSIRKVGKANNFARKWAETMTERYDELSKADPVFRDLRNLMDLSVVAALISREDLTGQVGLEIPTIAGKESMVSVSSLNVPKTVPTQCSFVKLTKSWIVTASGGVQVDSWSVAAKTEQVESLAQLHAVATEKTADRWWWNSTN